MADRREPAKAAGDRAGGRVWPRRDLVGGASLTFSALASARALFRVPTGDTALPSYIAVTAMLAGAAAAAGWLHRSREDDPRPSSCGARFAAVCALATWALLVPASSFARGLPVQQALLILGVLQFLAGAAIGCLLCGHPERSGLLVGACLLGGAGGDALPRLLATGGRLGPYLQAPLPAGAAALGALVLASPRRQPSATWAAVLALVLSAAAGVLPARGLAWPWLGRAGTPWTISAGEAAPYWRLLLWGAIAVLLSLLLFPGMEGERRRGLLRLHMITALWAAGAVLLCGLALRAAGITSAHVILLAGLGAAVGAIAVDTWALARRSLNRAFAAGLTGLAFAVALAHLPTSVLQAVLARPWAGGTLAVAIPLAVTAVAGMCGRIGLLVGPAYTPRLWACAGLSAVAAAASVAAPSARASSLGALTGAGVLCVAASVLLAAEVRVWRGSAGVVREWLRHEWSAREIVWSGLRLSGKDRQYPRAMETLRRFVYAGYAPWWLALLVLRGLAVGLATLGGVALAVVSGAVGSALRLVLGGEQHSPAEAAAVEREPVVELSPTSPGATPGDEGRPHRGAPGVEFGQVVMLPILVVAGGVDRVLYLLGAASHRLRRHRPPVEEAPAEEQPETETFGLTAPPDLSPGAAPTLAWVRESALKQRVLDSPWRRCFRSVLGFVKWTYIRDRLAPDIAESWDERVFRAELVASRGSRFELLGHLWMSRARRGCVVIVPIASGESKKAVEVRASRREVRDLARDDPDALKRLLLRAAYRLAVKDLSMGLYSSRTMACDLPRGDLIEPNQDRYCELREEVPGGGHRCKVPMQQDAARGATTLAACEQCDFPEIWARCSSLKLEGTIGLTDEDGTFTRRAHVICRLQGTRPELEHCLREECFSPTTITRVLTLDSARTR